MASRSVCIIVENQPVPFDPRVWKEARTLRSAGYRVAVICPKGLGAESSRETIDGIEIYRHWAWNASGRCGHLLEYLWAFGAEFLLALRVYARTRFQILQACNPPDTIFLIGLVFKLLGVRFVFDHHDLSPELYQARFGRRDWLYRLACLAERLTFLTADYSVATNDSFREIATTRGGVNPERVCVVRTCPDLVEVDRAKERPELKRGKRYLVVYVGIMEPQDGVELLLQSIEYIVNQKRRQDILFVLLGSGSELPRLRSLASKWKLDEFVEFTGMVPRAEVGTYLSTADVCVAPDPNSPLNNLCTMVKIFEYMAHSRPTVLYDLLEGRRAAGEAALYARDNDPQDFAEQILRLLDSEPLRKDLGEHGRKRIEDGLNWQSESRKLLEVYGAMCAEADNRKRPARAAQSATPSEERRRAE